MKNKLIDVREQKQLGRNSSYVDTTRCVFVYRVIDVLWCINSCHDALEGHRLSLPYVFIVISELTMLETMVTNKYLHV